MDPELADRLLAKQLADEEARAARKRDLTLTDDPYGLGTWVRGWLDPITTDMFRTALEPLAKPMPTTADGPDTRSHPQRLGDGFAEMIRRYLDSGTSPSQGGEKPHLVITIGWENFRDGTGTATLLRTGTPISTRTAQTYGCDAKISWYTPGGSKNGNGAGSGDGDSAGWPGGSGDREAGLSDAVRLFTGKTRRLLELRDRGCAFPGCDRPPAWTQGHHIIAWSKGGPTTVDNGVLLCGHHHRLIHQGHWTVTIADDGHARIHPARLDRPPPPTTPQPPTPQLRSHRTGTIRWRRPPEIGVRWPEAMNKHVAADPRVAHDPARLGCQAPSAGSTNRSYHSRYTFSWNSGASFFQNVSWAA